MKSELKKMMIHDENGRYWMIGSKTGGWYVYDGSTWNAADPFAHEEAPLVLQPEMARTEKIPVPAKERRQPAGEESEVFCKYCLSRMGEHDAYCKFCGASQKAAARAQERRLPDGEMLVKSVRIISLIFFFGGLGLVAGVIFGATFGIFKIFGDWIFQFPMMLQEMRGKIQGGLFFGAMGGIAGFIGFAAAGRPGRPALQRPGLRFRRPALQDQILTAAGAAFSKNWAIKGAAGSGNPAKLQFLQAFHRHCRQPAVFFTDLPVFKQKKQIENMFSTQPPTPRGGMASPDVSQSLGMALLLLLRREGKEKFPPLFRKERG